MADAGTLFNPYSMQGEAWDILKSKFIEGKIGMLITSIASSSEIQRLGRENGFETVLAFQPMGTEYSVPTGGNNIIMFEMCIRDRCSTIPRRRYTAILPISSPHGSSVTRV